MPHDTTLHLCEHPWPVLVIMIDRYNRDLRLNGGTRAWQRRACSLLPEQYLLHPPSLTRRSTSATRKSAWTLQGRLSPGAVLQEEPCGGGARGRWHGSKLDSGVSPPSGLLYGRRRL